MCEIPMSYGFLCALCGVRWSGFYVYGDPLPETSICPDCEKKFDKLELSWGCGRASGSIVGAIC